MATPDSTSIITFYYLRYFYALQFMSSLLQIFAALRKKVLILFTWVRIKKALRLVIRGDFFQLHALLKTVFSKKAEELRGVQSVETFTPIPLDPYRPLVSIIIPCFNYGSYVVDAITSILKQTLKNVEIIVVDGGSTDVYTVELLKHLIKPKTKIIFREGRHFVGSNRNLGIQLASGRYICCLDADDTLAPTYLEKAVFNLETYGYDVVSTGINYVGEKSGTLDCLEFPNLEHMVRGNHVLTCAVFRKKLWDKSAGYVDTGIGPNHVAEDWDFWVRLAADGARIRNMTREHLFNYRIHKSGSLSSASNVKPLSDQKAAILEKNKKILTSEAFRFSVKQQVRNLRSDPCASALALNFDTNNVSRKKTLLLAMPFAIVGGAERLLSGLCMYLVNANWRVVIITTLEQDTSYGSSREWFERSSSEFYSLPLFLAANEQVDFVEYLVASRKPDCVLNTGSRLLYEMLPSLKAKYIDIFFVDLLFNTQGHASSHIEFKHYLDFALAENQEVFEWYKNIAKWPTNKIRKLPSGVDLARLKPNNRPHRLIEKYGLSEDTLIFGFSGRLSKEKAPEIFIEIAKLCKNIPDIFFVMTGGGPMASEITALVQNIPPQINFVYAGLVDDVDEYLALYDVLVLPSRIDGRPLVVMEALACGVPVIASNVGALSDLIEDGVNGYLLPTAEPVEFANCIRQLIANSQVLNRLKMNARISAEQNLDSNLAYEEYERVLCNTINWA
jgi:glycosyltransferase involved in cell wall biosynthesis